MFRKPRAIQHNNIKGMGDRMPSWSTTELLGNRRKATAAEQNHRKMVGYMRSKRKRTTLTTMLGRELQTLLSDSDPDGEDAARQKRREMMNTVFSGWRHHCLLYGRKRVQARKDARIAWVEKQRDAVAHRAKGEQERLAMLAGPRDAGGDAVEQSTPKKHGHAAEDDEEPLVKRGMKLIEMSQKYLGNGNDVGQISNRKAATKRMHLDFLDGDLSLLLPALREKPEQESGFTLEEKDRRHQRHAGSESFTPHSARLEYSSRNRRRGIDMH
eukprot:TRINITY_DN21474_c0_g2_i3.p1 TRINITY_DN21474_c0_g2~~TRINITY_DN21474_c0_g2_i3.p1  ORF type:complete len:270 (-),score=57.42 TRINITY_DN21474_c0_g2_i3:78-887(-)